MRKTHFLEQTNNIRICFLKVIQDDFFARLRSTLFEAGKVYGKLTFLDLETSKFISSLSMVVYIPILPNFTNRPVNFFDQNLQILIMHSFCP